MYFVLNTSHDHRPLYGLSLDSLVMLICNMALEHHFVTDEQKRNKIYVDLYSRICSTQLHNITI